MNESPVSTLEQKKDRRGLLGLIGAGGAAAVAALLTRSNGAEAAHNPIYHESETNAPAVYGMNINVGGGVAGGAISGRGVHGWSYTGIGVFGSRWESTGTGAGVQGFSGLGPNAEEDAPDRVGVRGVGLDTGVRGEGSRGVTGTSDNGVGTGVFGSSLSAGPVAPAFLLGAIGVQGTSTGIGVRGGGNKTGVRGEGKTGVYGVGKWAVLGSANTAGGAGVFGNAGTGSTGVYATASGTKAALKVRGRSSFRQSGKATVSAGATSKVVPLTFTLAPGSLVVATLQGNAGSSVAVRTAAKYGSNKIRITLTKKATKSATIAYFIFTP